MPIEITEPLPKWLAGAMVAVIGVLAGVVAYLFKLYQKRERVIAAERAKMGEERAQWMLAEQRRADERERFETALRAEYEQKHRELIEAHADTAREERQLARDHEERMRADFAAALGAARKDFGDIMERVSAEASQAAAQLSNVLDRFYDRFVGPRRRGY